MARYLCQLCNTIVHDGENHPCFANQNEDEVYVVPQPDELEEIDGKQSEETHTGNSSANIGNACQVAQNNDMQERNETNSVLTEYNQQPPSRRKSHSSLLPSVCRLGAKKRRLDTESASSSHMERILKNSTTKKPKIYSNIANVSARVLQTKDSSSSEMSNHSLLSVSDATVVSVAGPSGIRTHTRRDGKEKAFVCDVCGKAFARWDHLERHERTHTGDKPFACKTCGKGFAQKGNLKTHLLTHTGEKPFQCDFCGKRYALKQSFLSHRRIHTGEKPYKCKFCDQKFKHRSARNRHQRRDHAEMK